MSIISTTSSGESTEQTPLDLGLTGASSNSITYVINQGTAPANYSYDILNISGSVGNAYLGSIKSQIRCNGCVATFNRSNAFALTSSSAGTFNSCASYIAAQGFVAVDGSSSVIERSVSSIAQNNYRANSASSINTSYCASVFPVIYGVRVNGSSSWTSSEFETITVSWNQSTALIPHHFYSSSNSYCRNGSSQLTTKSSSVGISGSVLNPRSISFVWCGINELITPTTTSTNILANNQASYRYVPIQQSLDFPNIGGNAAGGGLLPSDPLSSTGLVALMRFGRDCYDSTKPPMSLFPPEDRSGITGPLNGLTGPFNIRTISDIYL
jgi:hypothetical protein